MVKIQEIKPVSPCKTPRKMELSLMTLCHQRLTSFSDSSGPVVMDMSGYTEKGFKRKLAVQALFGKVYYLSEVSGFNG